MIFLTDEELRETYSAEEFDALRKMRRTLEGLPKNRAHELGREMLRALWPDELERIAKTHWINTKDRGLQLLVPNYAQVRFYEDVIQARRKEGLPIRGIILKARQLGFSTFIQAWQFEQCDSNRHRVAMTISFDDPSTAELFQKAHLIYERQFFPLPKRRFSGKILHFEEPHGSQFHTRTAGNLSAGRSQTIHHLHCSEVPMWSTPDETLTSVCQAVPMTPASSIFIESTAKGAVGVFYDWWQESEKGERDYVPFFAPWKWDPEYSLPFATSVAREKFVRGMKEKDRRYMRRHELSYEQMNWRAWKIRNDLHNSEKLFRQEYPADATEAFLSTGSPVFSAEKLLELQEQAVNPIWVGDLMLVRR